MTVTLKVHHKGIEALARLPKENSSLLLLLSPQNAKASHLIVEGYRGLEFSSDRLTFQTDRAMVFRVGKQTLTYGTTPKICIASNGALQWANQFFDQFCVNIYPSKVIAQTIGSEASYGMSGIRSSKEATSYIQQLIADASRPRLALLKD